ncbi:hypothetical protein IFM89_007617 [Coptis chinensis]|uniref:3-ketoacyl-CoA synthase n=1 Tax=Coptis chinensis TaxID=261450 RepID=A0A835GWJ5_9MAGN|nr:hypothetical protein IFM89_007617 [Coptis chinensis]
MADIGSHFLNINFFDLFKFFNHNPSIFNILHIFICLMLFFSLTKLSTVINTLISSRPKLFLIDFSCYKPDDTLKCSHDVFIERSALLQIFSKESLEFQKTILEKSGLGQSTYFPRPMWGLPPNPCMAEARHEVETVVYGAINELLAKTSIKVTDIGIIIANSSLFNPTPSLCSMIVNHYKLDSSVLSYNLGGMGCSAGLISIDLAKHLLQVHPNTYALVVSTENITLNWYFGSNRSMLVSNCLFRMGAGAILLSNRPSDGKHAKYQLNHVVRTHKANEDRGYYCAFQEEDANGKVGVTLSKELSSVAGEALRTNITTLGPLVLPIAEQLRFLANLVQRKVLNIPVAPYVPDFKLAFDHICIHAGGKAILDKVENSLKLTKQLLEPSRMTLYRFGNTSSSSLWYELAYLEAKGKIKKGDKVCQLAFGSGFKCNSAIWVSLRTVVPAFEKSPWIDELDTHSSYLACSHD